MKREQHPRLTPMRALVLLLNVQHELGATEGLANRSRYVLERVRNELASHVRASMTSRRRGARRR
jgi:hypothetical protein